jgi:UDP-glucose 4-epimerase
MTMKSTQPGLRLVVTGATGFIGSRAVAALEGMGHHVLRLQRGVADGEIGNFVPWDLGGDDSNWPGLLRGCDAVIHLAAYIPADYADLGECQKCLDLNALGTLRLLRAAEAAGVSHFVHASTAALYAPAADNAREDSLMLPVRAPAYLASKLAAEVYVAHMANRNTLQCSVLRLASVYGPGMADFGLVPNCYKQLRSTGTFVVADGNRYQTDLVYVDDVVSAIVACLGQESGRIYNIASGQLSTPLQVATSIAGLLSIDPGGITVAPPLEGPGVRTYGGLDIELARRYLGMVPRPLAEGLQYYVRGRQ